MLRNVRSIARVGAFAVLVSASVACQDKPRSGAQLAAARDAIGRGNARGPRDAMAPRAPWELATTVAYENGADSHAIVASVPTADILADGRVVVADATTGAVQLYSQNGAYLRDVAQRPHGVSESMSSMWVGVMRGDTIVSYDATTRGFDLRTTDNLSATRRPIPLAMPSGMAPTVVSPDGVVVFAQLAQKVARGTARVGLVRDSGRVALLSTSDQSVHLLGATPMREYVADGAGANAISTPFPFHAELFSAACNDGAFVGWSADSVVTFAGWDGEVYDSIAIPLPAVPTPAWAWQTALKSLPSSLPAEKATRVKAALDHVPAPTYLPRYSGLIAEGCDRLWVRPYTMAADTSSIWIAYDRGGRLVDREELEGDAQIVRIRGRRVLVSARNADGAIELRVYDRQRRN